MKGASSTSNTQQPPSQTKCKRKRNPLPSLKVKRDLEGNIAVDDNETLIVAQDCATKICQQSDIPSTSKMPEKSVLQMALDTIQRRDIYELFAEPVDPEEVEDYYEIIEEPMDFGTMRAKLHEGMYTSLEQFEHDVLLITKNAMHFNSSRTMYYRQARAIHELSKNVLCVLKSHPTDFQAQFYGIRRKTNRRACGDSCSSARAPSYRRGVQDDTHCAHYTNRMGPTKGAQYDRCGTYRPPISEFNKVGPSEDTLELIMARQGSMGYVQSLMLFTKDLGPIAQEIARKKCLEMQSCSTYIPQTSQNHSLKKPTVILGLAAPHAGAGGHLQSDRGIPDHKMGKTISIDYDKRNKHSVMNKNSSVCDDDSKFKERKEVDMKISNGFGCHMIPQVNKSSIMLNLNASITNDSNPDVLSAWNSKDLGTTSGATSDSKTRDRYQSLKSAVQGEACRLNNHHPLRWFRESNVDFTNCGAPQSQAISCTQTPWNDTFHARKADQSNSLLGTNNKYTFDLPYIQAKLESMKR